LESEEGCYIRIGAPDFVIIDALALRAASQSLNRGVVGIECSEQKGVVQMQAHARHPKQKGEEALR
jgi:hypothetical protein